jgi:hypothetical protein
VNYSGGAVRRETSRLVCGQINLASRRKFDAYCGWVDYQHHSIISGRLTFAIKL